MVKIQEPGLFRLNKPLGFTLVLSSLVLAGCDKVEKAVDMKTAELIGTVANGSMPDDVAGGFHNIPIKVVKIADDVYQAMGIGNTHLIKASEGNVLFDTGLVTQAPKQLKLLKEVAPERVTDIILSHAHFDHMGGARFWKEEGTRIIAHREYTEKQRSLAELEPFYHQRNRVVFPWLPEQLPDVDVLKYGGITPDIEVTESDYTFEKGGVTFEVLSTPGAEGDDNISLWLPQKKILFTGDALGPNFPQFPNVFTMRGEKIRKPVEYIQSLDKLIALQPEILVPSHRDHIVGQEAIVAGLTLIRDAVQYVHDAVVKGMNEGKTVHQLMDEVVLPPHLELSQEHGRVSWAVKSIWEYYATWFHFDTPTELYSVPVSDVYQDLASMAGSDQLLKKAQESIAAGEMIKAQHFIEVGLSADPENLDLLNEQLKVFETLLDDAVNVTRNNYEKDYLRSLISNTKSKIDSARAESSIQL